MESVYPQEPGYDPKAAKSAIVQYPGTTAIRLPDALRGDKADKWALVSLEASAFEEMNDWDVGFSEAFQRAALTFDRFSHQRLTAGGMGKLFIEH